MAIRWQHCVQFDRPEIEPQTFRSRNEHVTVRPTDRSVFVFRRQDYDISLRRPGAYPFLAMVWIQNEQGLEKTYSIQVMLNG